MYYQKQADEKSHLYFARYADGYYDHYNPLPHFHNSIELYVVTEGEYDINVGGDRRRVKAGEIAFVDRFVSHSSGRLSDAEAEVFVIVASADYFESVPFLKKHTLPAFTEEKEGFSKIADLVRWAYAAGKMKEDATRGFITLLLSLLQDYCGEISRTGEKHTRVLADVMRYIDENYDKDITLPALSERFGYEPSYLSRLFNQTLGMNLREYLGRIRVRAVKRMRAMYPDWPTVVVLYGCGFRNENTYYRAMRRYGNE